ncbi:hypothetical protein RSAG8_12711, partial [Rhizoctonia solani AG-8 WAC10335]
MGVILPELARWRHLIIVVPDFKVTYSAVSMVGDAFKTNKTLSHNLEVLRLYGPPKFDPNLEIYLRQSPTSGPFTPTRMTKTSLTLPRAYEMLYYAEYHLRSLNLPTSPLDLPNCTLLYLMLTVGPFPLMVIPSP